MHSLLAEFQQGEVNQVTPPAKLSDLEGVFEGVVTSVLALAGIVLFIMLVMGGFRYITAGSDPKNAEAAKNTLTYAIIGIVFIALSFLFLQLISWFTGVDVTIFKVTI